MKTRTYLDVRFDVTHLSDDERGALALEVAVQAEESDFVGDDGHGWIGHGGVEPPEIEWNEVVVDDAWLVGKVGGDSMARAKSKEEAEAMIAGIGLADPEGVADGMYFIDPPNEDEGPGESSIYSNSTRCPKCGSSDTRRATVYWQCLTCSHEWPGDAQPGREGTSPASSGHAPTKPDGRPMPEAGSKEGVTTALLPFIRMVEDAWCAETKGDLDLSGDDGSLVSIVLDLRLLALQNIEAPGGGQFDNYGRELNADEEVTPEMIAVRIARAINIVCYGGER